MKQRLFSRISVRLRGYTIAELSVSLTIFGLILVMTTFILAQARNAWIVSDSKETAALRLRQAKTSLQRDFESASHENVGVSSSPASLAGGGKDGDTLVFLSPIDPANSQIVRNSSGEPLWQRNILYYLTVPLNHVTCKGTVGPGGYEASCPHKVLVRKVINNPGSGGTQELLTDVSSYLDRPATDNTSPTGGGSKLEDSQVVATDLLWFAVTTNPSSGPGAVVIDARTVALESAQRNARAGAQSYASGPYTVNARLSLVPHN